MADNKIANIVPILSGIIALMTIIGGFVKVSTSFATVENKVEATSEKLKDQEDRLRTVETCVAEQKVYLSNIKEGQKEMLEILKSKGTK